MKRSDSLGVFTIGDYIFYKDEKFDESKLYRKYEVHHQITNDVYSAYEFDRSKLSQCHAMESQVEILGSLNHQHIQQLIEVIIQGTCLFAICELDTTTFDKTLMKHKENYLPENAQAIFLSIMEAVAEIHSKHIVHLDIGPHSIFTKLKEKKIKLGYFFHAVQNPSHRERPRGVLNFQAPEVVSGEPFDPFKADIWSCGILLYIILTYAVPFQGPDEISVKKAILENDIKIEPYIQGSVRNILESMLNRNPDKRPTAEDILKHPWLSIQYPLNILKPRKKADDAALLATNKTPKEARMAIATYLNSNYRVKIQYKENYGIIVQIDDLIIMFTANEQSNGNVVYEVKKRKGEQFLFQHIMLKLESLFK